MYVKVIMLLSSKFQVAGSITYQCGPELAPSNHIIVAILAIHLHDCSITPQFFVFCNLDHLKSTISADPCLLALA